MKKLFFILFAIIGLASCSETDENDAKYADWQQRNDMFFEGIYKQAKDSISAGSKNWYVIKSLSKNDSVSTKPTDHIVVNVLRHGTGTVNPLQTDSVRVHYKGYLMNTDYTSSAQVSSLFSDGKSFDSSWTGPYDLSTMVPTKFIVSGVVDGFGTALQNMHTGDRWKVYIPNNLGYGSAAQGSIPEYSTLIFDLTLQAIGKPGNPMP